MWMLTLGYLKSIQIRDVPEQVHASLRAKAATAGLSLSEYLLWEVTKIASRPSTPEVLKRAAKREWGSPRHGRRGPQTPSRRRA